MSNRSGIAWKIALAVGIGFYFGEMMVYSYYDDLLRDTSQVADRAEYYHLIVNASVLVGILVWAVISALDSGQSYRSKAIQLLLMVVAVISIHSIYSPLAFMLNDWRTYAVLNILLWLVLYLIVWYFNKPKEEFTVYSSERRFWWGFHRTSTTVRRSRRP